MKLCATHIIIRAGRKSAYGKKRCYCSKSEKFIIFFAVAEKFASIMSFAKLFQMFDSARVRDVES